MISLKDNDSLSALLSVELKADLLMMLSDVHGIYSGPPDQPESRLLDTFRPNDVSNIEFGDKSRVGRGGMESKVKVYFHNCQLVLNARNNVKFVDKQRLPVNIQKDVVLPCPSVL